MNSERESGMDPDPELQECSKLIYPLTCLEHSYSCRGKHKITYRTKEIYILAIQFDRQADRQID